ncbi:MAG: lectin-like protein [Woeseiaceae bacterium]
MNYRTIRLAGLSLLAILGATSAYAQEAPVVNPETGHYYQVFDTGPITWDAAEAAVDILPCLLPDGDEGIGELCEEPGAIFPHLATITSSREEIFVDTLRDEVLEAGGGAGQTWIGGIQDDPEGDWNWVNDEGTFPDSNGGTVYTNWAPNEPNNSGNEDHVTLGRYSLGGGWNDELQTRTSIVGYIAEWDVPLDAAGCVGAGCETVMGQTITVPAASVPAGATISFNSFEFLDPRVDNNPASPTYGQCVTREPLRLFGNTGIGSAPGVRPEMFIPAYLCGSPEFVIVALDSGELVIETGTVGVANETDDVLPNNFYPGAGGPITGSVCEDPITQNFPNEGDPQYQDVSLWQDTETPTKMLEVDPGVGGTGDFEGATGEFTDACGSSRMRVRGGSYFGIGFHIDFGPGNTWAGNTAGNFDSFVNLTDYKISLLQESVERAFDSGAIDFGAYRLLKIYARYADIQLGRGNYSRALTYINAFISRVNTTSYSVTATNWNGEHIMRSANIEFMLRVKVMPYAP